MAATPSLTGKQLGVYRLGSLLGTGGMGEVYRATDTRLERDVAVKVLPASFAHDADRVRRLEREARLLAALNHPNIAVIYGVEEGDGLLALVLELVEGRTLAERIAGGRLAISEVSHMAGQIAHALEAAHEKGIIHRDLKPANIRVRPDGVVKVLDFGLAKAFTGDGAPTGEAPTATGTRDGVVVGTAAYMSPEQARGQPVDKRTDIWAFGCVLYEMLTGRSPFAGATWSDAIAAVLNREPDWASLPGATPSSMRRLLRRCLEKDPQHRIRDIADARFDLDDEPPGEPVAAHQPSQWLKRLAAPAVLGLIAAAGLVLWYGSRTRQASTAPLRAVPLTTYPGRETHPSLSPDGNQIAFAWNGQTQDNVDIYVKLIGAGEPIRLTTDPGVDTSPAWSPDGRWIAFVRLLPNERATLILVPALSGPEQPLGEIAVTSFIHGSALGSAVSWSPDSSSLIIADKPPDGPQGLFAFSVATRAKRRLTTLPPKAWTDIGPALSPDGRMLAFMRFIAFGVGDLHLLSVTEDLQPKGNPKRLTQQNRFATAPTWMRDGRSIIFSSASSLTASVGGLVAVEASGQEGAASQPRPLTSVGENASHPVISRTSEGGRSRMVYTQWHADTSIWRVELPGGAGVASAAGVKPLPFVRSTRPEHMPQYSPDGQKVVFVSHTSGDGEIWVCNKDGGNLVQLTTAGWAETQTPRWSPDGSQIVFQARRDGPSDIFAVSATGGAPKRISDDPADDWGPSWSRDGQWIYFTSNRSDRSEVWKMPAGGGGTAVQVTKSGGAGPSVSPDGRYVYFVKPGGGGGLWRLEVDTGAESRIPIAPWDWSRYSATESGIYFIPLAKSGDEYSIQFFSFSTQKIHTVVLLEKGTFLGLTISPDGRWLLYSQSEQFDSDLMLVEDFR